MNKDVLADGVNKFNAKDYIEEVEDNCFEGDTFEGDTFYRAPSAYPDRGLFKRSYDFTRNLIDKYFIDFDSDEVNFQ